LQVNLDTISEEGLEGLENLLDHSLQGIHLLFENDRVKKILSTPSEKTDFFSFENIEHVQELMTALLQKESFFAKVCFIQSLDDRKYETLVRAYFHILERAAQASDIELH